jgi:hypothetical protein
MPGHEHANAHRIVPHEVEEDETLLLLKKISGGLTLLAHYR